MTEWLLIVNRDAGAATDDAVEQVEAELGDDVEIATTASPDDLDEALGSLADRTPVIVGGDGSVSLAVDRARRLGVDRPFGIVPCGTGNDLARGLGIPIDPAAAARSLRRARPRFLPVLDAGDRSAVNALHVGAGAVAAERAVALKPAIGALAYPVGAAAAGVEGTTWTFEVEVDGEPAHRGEALMVACLIGTSIGGGTELGRREAVATSRAELVVLRAETAIDRVRLGFELLAGDHVERDDVEVFEFTHARIRSEPAAPLNLDGELLGGRSDLDLHLRLGAWRALVPTD